jgi:4-alpha-glucanotransferase
VNTCRDPKAVATARDEHREAIELFVAEQYLFDKQWTAVKAGTCSGLACPSDLSTNDV